MSSNSAGCSSQASASGDSVSLELQSAGSFVEWNEGAVVLEMKVNEPATISIFCPLPETSEQKCVEVVKFSENSIEFMRDLSPENAKESTLRRYAVTFPDQQFDPKSVSAETWSESRRLFTCRVNLQYKDYVCGLRRFFEIQAYMSNKVPLQQYCERLSNNGAKISCRVCLTTFFMTGEKSPMKFMMSNDDPILNELGNCELNDFVVHSCANQHGCHGKKDSLLKVDDAKNGMKANLPTDDRTHLSDTYLTIRKTDNLAGSMIDSENRIVNCKGCVNELGHVSKVHPNILQLHLTGLNIDDQNMNRNLIAERFESLERYFAFLMLRHSGIDSSLKLIFRSCDKEPYILVWLIEPIFVFGGGKLKEVVDGEVSAPTKTKSRRNSSNIDASVINTFCALKVLYRVFGTSNGSDHYKHSAIDSSISYIDIPLASCMALEEILLRNSTRLPNNSRTLGNFLISFLNIDDE